MPIPRNFDYIAHNARVASQRSQMRADENIARTDQRSGPPVSPPTSPSAVLLGPAVPAAPLRPSADPARPTPRGAGPVYPLVGLCRAAGLPEPVPEYQFHSARRWRFDFAWPMQRIAIEIDGGIWSQGRHTRGSGYLRDLAKFNAAMMLGWKVLKYAPDQMGQAITDLRIMFAGDAA